MGDKVKYEEVLDNNWRLLEISDDITRNKDIKQEMKGDIRK